MYRSFLDNREPVELDVKLRWFGEHEPYRLSVRSGALPGRHVTLEVARDLQSSEDLTFGCEFLSIPLAKWSSHQIFATTD